MDQKLPYYMAYPMTLDFEDERAERMDYEYLRSMYPEIPKTILPYVEEECDRMAYENSMIYDQYPDKLQLKLMCRRVYDNVRKHERMFYEDEDQRISEGNTEGEKISATVRERGRNRDNSPASLRDFIEVMLYQDSWQGCRRRLVVDCLVKRCRLLYVVQVRLTIRPVR